MPMKAIVSAATIAVQQLGIGTPDKPWKTVDTFTPEEAETLAAELIKAAYEARTSRNIALKERVTEIEAQIDALRAEKERIAGQISPLPLKMGPVKFQNIDPNLVGPLVGPARGDFTVGSAA